MRTAIDESALAPSRITLFRSRDDALISTGRNGDRMHRVRRGVYADALAWRRLKPWERYAARVEAVALTWDAPIFCLESAATRLSLPTFGETRDIHLLDTEGKSRRYGDVVVHTTADDVELVTSAGFTSTGIRDTTLGLCRVLPPAFGLGVADAALRALAQTGTRLDLAAARQERSDRRGVRRLDWIGARASVVAESVGESVSRAVIEWLGFASPDLQTDFVEEEITDRTDFYWRAARVIGESDGYGKYDATNPEAMRAHFIREKVREDRLRRHVKGFARWDWGDTMRAIPLGDKLRAAGLTAVSPRNAALLSTLRRNPRAL